jgi:hypothetical protein
MTLPAQCLRLLLAGSLLVSALAILLNVVGLLFYVIPSLAITSIPGIDLGWYPPKKSHINTLDSVISGDGTYGFVFNSSQNPSGVRYGTYNWCNMPHVRKEEYPLVSNEYELSYVEVVCIWFIFSST